MSVKPIPDGYHALTPYLIVNDAGAAIEFYRRAFDAVELFRLEAGDGKLGHAEIKIGDSPLLLADEYPDQGFKSPQSLGGTAVSLSLYVENVDSAFTRALAAGATEIRAVQNQFYGDRAGTLRDPFGHVWTLATHIEDVAPDELQRRMQGMGGG